MSGNRRGNKSGSRSRGKGKSARDFWGPEDVDEVAAGPVRVADHPTALIRSLGPPPLPNGAVAEHYFAVVYERTAQLAVALAASAGLIAIEEITSD
ncbi:MAG: hypothetical protein U0W40_19300 [Acidimicrobiia bacterium]